MVIFGESEEEIRENLYLGGEEFEDYWNEWKADLIKTIRKFEEIYKDKFCCWSYCLESDLDYERDFLEELGRELKIVANEKGLIIYEYV